MCCYNFWTFAHIFSTKTCFLGWHKLPYFFLLSLCQFCPLAVRFCDATAGLGSMTYFYSDYYYFCIIAQIFVAYYCLLFNVTISAHQSTVQSCKLVSPSHVIHGSAPHTRGEDSTPVASLTGLWPQEARRGKRGTHTIVLVPVSYQKAKLSNYTLIQSMLDNYSNLASNCATK